MDEQNLNRTFARYMSLNILGMLGMSGYILADTFFVSSRLGSDGLAALNLAISVFGFINGLGMMLGIGGATRNAICKAREDDREANASFTLSLVAGIGAGVVLVLFGLLFSRPLAGLLGAEDRILPMCAVYLRTAFLFAPFFILNHILVAFVRNDGSPKLAMTAMLVGSLSNIVLDYLFLYPLNMGIFGAALATGTAPIIGIAISSIHIFSGRSQFKAVPTGLSLRKMAAVAGLGIAAFINEFSSGITLVVFNLLVMHAAGTAWWPIWLWWCCPSSPASPRAASPCSATPTACRTCPWSAGCTTWPCCWPPLWVCWPWAPPSSSPRSWCPSSTARATPRCRPSPSRGCGCTSSPAPLPGATW